MLVAVEAERGMAPDSADRVMLNLHDSFLMVQRNMFTISVMFIMQHLYPGVSSSLLAKLLVKPDATIMTGAFELHGCSPNSDG